MQTATNFKNIPFNKPHFSNAEINNVIAAIQSGKICGDGKFTHLCNDWFKENIGKNTLLTTSCTSALEMMAILLDAKVGDVITLLDETLPIDDWAKAMGTIHYEIICHLKARLARVYTR